MSYVINDDCVMCDRCVKACAKQAIYFDGDKRSINQELCVDCGACVKACLMRAIHPEGYVEPEVPQRETALELNCDLVVVGSGPSGLCAAIRAAEEGYKVIVLEALKTFGGAGWYGGGMYRVFGTKWEREAGLPDKTDDYIRASMEMTHWMLNPKLIFNAFHAVGECFDWFDSWGNASECFVLQEFPPYGKMVDLNMSTFAGPFFCEKYIQRCRELGVDLRAEHRGRKLLMEGNQVVGVVAQDPAGEVVIHANACLLATGNMSMSSDLEKYVPVYARSDQFRSPHRLPTNLGDGVRMAEEAGIPIDEQGIVPHYFGSLPQSIDSRIFRYATRNEGISVNLNGERYADECVSRGESMHQLVHAPRSVSYTVIDSKIFASEPLPSFKLPSAEGGNILQAIPRKDRPVIKTGAIGFAVQYDEDGNPIETVVEKVGKTGAMNTHIQQNAESDAEFLKKMAALPGGNVCVADTLEELAEAMGVPAENFVKTVERYNEMCKKGHDDDFAKFPEYMIPIQQPPFYGFKCCLGTDGVFGGIRIDENCQVLGADGPVEGLYSSGDITSGNYLKENHRRIEAIDDLSWANASGFLASKGIVKYLSNKK